MYLLTTNEWMVDIEWGQNIGDDHGNYGITSDKESLMEINIRVYHPHRRI